MRAGRVLVVVAVGVALAISTASRVHVWTDEQRLWADAAEKAPRKPRPWVNLGKQYQLAGDTTRAKRAYETAIALASDPSRGRDERVAGRAIAEANLALLWSAQGFNGAKALIASAAARLPYEVSIARASAAIAAHP